LKNNKKLNYFLWKTKNNNLIENNVFMIKWKKDINILKPQICNLYDALILKTNIKNTQISILWTYDKEMKTLNKKFRNINKPTNILSFPSNFVENNIKYLGDIVLSYETIQLERNKKLNENKNHILHLIVHGILHLLGFEHNSPEAAKKMEFLEINILSKFGIPNPYNK